MRLLELSLVGVSSFVLSDIYLEDFYLRIGSSTLGAFYAYFGMGTVPLIIYLFIWWRRHKHQEEDKFIHFLRIAFGYLWVLDAFLQMQPGMNEYFASTILSPNVSTGGITGYVSTFALSLWNMHPVVFDVVASLVQLYIGGVLLTQNRGRVYSLTQILTILWGLSIWILGEGFGGVFGSGETILTGFPGSALIYVYASIILLLSSENHHGMIYKSSSLFGAVIFIPALIVQLMLSFSHFWNMSSVYMPMPSPYGMLNFANEFQYYFTHSPVWPDIVALFLILASTAGWVSGKSYGYIFSGVLASFSWIVFQGLGILGILSTDPNTGLPLMIISIFFYLWTKKSFASRNGLKKHAFLAFDENHT